MELECMAQGRTRRSVLTGALRAVALGALVAIGGFTVAKRRRLRAEGKCINDGICRDCAVLVQCGLPAALLAKQSTQRGENDRAR
jgi:hypothetical protein